MFFKIISKLEIIKLEIYKFINYIVYYIIYNIDKLIVNYYIFKNNQ